MSSTALDDCAAIGPAPPRGPWLPYVGLCLVCWMLYTMAGAEWLRGGWRLWAAAYEATWSLWPPMLLGALVYPWLLWLQRRVPATGSQLLCHAGAALAFGAAWQGLDFVAARGCYGADHAWAQLEQRVLWRAVWGVLVYTALVLGFGSVLASRRAHGAALAAARADAARVRAELAAITGKLNPHFLFNTLNSLVMLTRRDPARAEDALHGFARLMRYVLDSQRGSGDHVPLADEVDFLRDYLQLESLRLGDRLRVVWRLEPSLLGRRIPPLTLQPLVENSIRHGIAPRPGGGTVRIEAAPHGDALALRVEDDGAGCDWPPADDGARAEAQPRSGIGLAALIRRFALDYCGRARIDVRSTPGAGFRVDILIPADA